MGPKKRKNLSFFHKKIQNVKNGAEYFIDHMVSSAFNRSRTFLEITLLMYVVYETPELIAIKFCMPRDIQDIITHANFGEDRLRGFGVAMGRILAFSIDLLRRL